MNSPVRNASPLEAIGEGSELTFMRGGEAHGVRAGRKPSRATLACGVDDVGGLNPARKVLPNDHVVREMEGFGGDGTEVGAMGG